MLLTGTLMILQGCQPEPAKTDTMLFREATINQAQVPLDKAAVLLTQDVKSAPLSHLDSIILANQNVRAARDIYAKNNINNYSDAKLIELENFIELLDPALVENAKSLLILAVDKTAELREQIEEAKNQPYSARGNDTAQLVEFLGKNYNRDVKECCLTTLSQIDQLLKNNSRQHRDLIILIRSINQELAEVIKQKDYALALKKRIRASQ